MQYILKVTIYTYIYSIHHTVGTQYEVIGYFHQNSLLIIRLLYIYKYMYIFYIYTYKYIHLTLMDCLKDRLCILKYSWIFKIVGVKDMAITFFCMVSK